MAAASSFILSDSSAIMAAGLIDCLLILSFKTLRASATAFLGIGTPSFWFIMAVTGMWGEALVKGMTFF